jgi:signal transduction histidine kinase
MQKRVFICFFLMLYNTLYSQTKIEIDSINNLYAQGLNMPQDAILSLFKNNSVAANKLNYGEGEADAFSKLSLVYGYQGNYKESVAHGLKAVKLYDSLGLSEKVAYRYAELGYSLKYKDMDKASYYMQQGMSIAEAKQDEYVLKDIYNNYGVLKEIKEELDSALYFYNKSLIIKKRINDTIGIPYCYSNMAGVYALQKDFQKAKKYFNLALEQRIQWKDSTTIAENYTQLGEVFLAEEKLDQAIPWIHKSLPLSRAKQYKNLTQYNYKLLSDIYKSKRNTDSALFYYEQYTAIKDSIHSTKVEESIAALTIEFETEKKENEILKQRTQLAEKDLEVRRKNTWIVGGFGMAAILGLLGYLVYNQQKLKQRQLQKESELKEALARIEMQNKLQEQRLRISRDLHDNIGSQLTFIISSIDTIKYGFSEISDKLSNKLVDISAFTSQTIYELRDTIWAMNKNSITFEDLRARITNFIEKAKIATETTKFDFSEASGMLVNTSLTSVEGMNCYRIIQEAVNNSLKYAKASLISVSIFEENKEIIIEISDNGSGFDVELVEQGNGLSNMKKRARDIGGEFTIDSKINKGTTVRLCLTSKKGE